MPMENEPDNGLERRTVPEYRLPADFHDRVAGIVRQVVRSELSPVAVKVDRIEHKLDGDGDGVNPGLTTSHLDLAQNVEKLEARVSVLEQLRLAVKWTVVGAAAGGGIAGGGLGAALVKVLGGP